MTVKFGEFKWNCYEDRQPESHLFVYVYYDGEHGVDVGLAGDYDWNKDMYWRYVFIPDEPVIDKRCDDKYLAEVIKRIDDYLADIKIRLTSLEYKIDRQP